MWSDGADKERYLALPGRSQIELDAIDYPQPAPGSLPGWKFPDGTVLVETISLEMETANRSSRRRLETRILHHERTPGTEEVGDQYWQGYTYIWNDLQDDATLLEDPQGKDRTFTIQDADAPDGRRQQTWHFPGRAECTVCHNMAAKYALGVNTLQLNKDHDYGGVIDNQLRTLEHLGVFTGPLPERTSQLPSLVDYRDSSQDVGDRARAYLHANCSHCHRKWGGGNAEFQLLQPLDLSDMGIVGTRPGQGEFHLTDARLLAPGDPYRSVLYFRMAKLGSGRMPRIGSTEVDEVGLNLIHDWIVQLSVAAGDAPGEQRIGELEAEDKAAHERIRNGEELPADARAKDLDRLLASTSSALRLLRATDDRQIPNNVVGEVVERASQSPHAHVRDLFERFLPESQRTKRLGSVINTDEILVLPGDGERGRAVFFDTAGVECKKCHRIGDVGGTVGPDLSEIGKKYNRTQLLETILQPSKEIDPKYVAYVAETNQGQVYSGVLVERSNDQVTLKDAEDKLIELRTEELERLAPQPTSLMPELLLRDLTARQVADLTEFLGSLK
jgi:putative heme-binding domain-containing protein